MNFINFFLNFAKIIAGTTLTIGSGIIIAVMTTVTSNPAILGGLALLTVIISPSSSIT